MVLDPRPAVGSVLNPLTGCLVYFLFFTKHLSVACPGLEQVSGPPVLHGQGPVGVWVRGSSSPVPEAGGRGPVVQLLHRA